MKEDSGRLQVVTGEKWKQAEGFKPNPAKSECLRHAKKAENTNCIYIGRGRNCSNWYKIRVTPFLSDPLFSWDFCTVSVKNCGVQFASNVNSFINNQYNTCKAWPIDKNSEQNSCTLKSRSFSATAPKDVFLQIWAAWPSSLPISQTVPCPSFPPEVQKVDHGLASNWQKKATTIKLTASGPSNKNLTRNPLSCGTHRHFWIAN